MTTRNSSGSRAPRGRVPAGVFLSSPDLLPREQLRLVAQAVVVGVLAALAAAGFRHLADLVMNLALFHTLSFAPRAPATLPARSLLIVVVPAIGSLAGGLLVRGAPEARGSGVPEVMEAIALHDGHVRARLMPIKTAASALTLGSGAAGGREGPIVQIAASAASLFARGLGVRPYFRRVLVACAAAGGIAAAFNTPIGGALFAIELLLPDRKPATLLAVASTSAAATIMARYVLGHYPALDIPFYDFAHPLDLPFFLLLGIAAGGVAAAFIRATRLVHALARNVPGPTWVHPAFGGLVTGAAGFLAPQVLGVGYPLINHVLGEGYGGAHVAAFGALEFVAAAAVIGTGGPVGVFAPSLVIGSAVGGVFGAAMHGPLPALATTGAYSLVGVGALLAGTTRATLTSVVFLFELTGNHQVLLPLLLAGLASAMVSSALHPETIYTEKLEEHDRTRPQNPLSAR